MFTLTAQREISLVDKVVAGDIRRQASEQFFYPNGAVYIAESKWLAKAPHFISSDAVAYEMPRMRSFDLDEQEDWEIIQKLTSKLR
jgi:N-acylneuraminate cytidylyltransferase